MSNEIENLKQIVEGVILVAGEPVSIDRIAKLFEKEERPDSKAIRAVIKELMAECEGRGIELQEVASGFCYQARAELAPWIGKLWEQKSPKYSRALLETMAIIAYKQPVTRGDIENIRGIAVSTNMIKTLEEREWIKVLGQRDVPGKPSIFGTTKEFLDYFNLKSISDLPELPEIKDVDDLVEQMDLQLAGEFSETAKVEESDSSAEVLDGDVSQEADVVKIADADEMEEITEAEDFDEIPDADEMEEITEAAVLDEVVEAENGDEVAEAEETKLEDIEFA